VVPDVVHLHSSKAGLAGRLAVRGHCPTIFQPHCWSWLAVTGPLRWVTLRWERLACRWSTVVVCVGDGEASAGHAAGLHAPVRIVRNGVDRTRLRPAGDDEKRRARHDLGVPSDAPLVICAGRLTRQKGQDVLLEAWPAVRRRCPNAHLVLIGDGAVALQPRVAPTGARFEPAVHDIRPWLAAADIVAVPSRWEGLPLIALEAVATGRPVVGSAVGGLTEVVTARVGCLVEPDDPVALADALAARLTDPVLAAEEGRHAVALAARFDQRRTLDLLAELTLTAAWERPI
jgi:glycosyltransferase involved in cell wall biosynthesis